MPRRPVSPRPGQKSPPRRRRPARVAGASHRRARVPPPTLLGTSGAAVWLTGWPYVAPGRTVPRPRPCGGGVPGRRRGREEGPEATSSEPSVVVRRAGARGAGGSGRSGRGPRAALPGAGGRPAVARGPGRLRPDGDPGRGVADRQHRGRLRRRRAPARPPARRGRVPLLGLKEPSPAAGAPWYRGGDARSAAAGEARRLTGAAPAAAPGRGAGRGARAPARTGGEARMSQTMGTPATGASGPAAAARRRRRRRDAARWRRHRPPRPN